MLLAEAVRTSTNHNFLNKSKEVQKQIKEKKSNKSINLKNLSIIFVPRIISNCRALYVDMYCI